MPEPTVDLLPLAPPRQTGSLPPLPAQAERLVDLGVHDLADVRADDLRSLVAGESASTTGELLVLPETVVPASMLAPLLRLGERNGFVVADMTDVDTFTPIDGVDLPGGAGYVVRGVERGDEMPAGAPTRRYRPSPLRAERP